MIFSGRDALLVYLFTTIGLNAKLFDLLKGGPILAVLFGLTIAFMFVQNLVGILGTTLWGLPPKVRVMMGTAALIGGHGTAIACGPVVAKQDGVVGAVKLGSATATLGLIVAILLGSPITRVLIYRHDLAPAGLDAGDTADGADIQAATAHDTITNSSRKESLLWIHVAMMIGFGIHESLVAANVNLPVFVPCLLTGILLSTLVPKVMRHWRSPAGTPAMRGVWSPR